MADVPKIYKAMIGVMKEVGVIPKNQTNQAQHYSFRGIDDLYNALQPAMVHNGVLHLPELLEESHDIDVRKSTFYEWDNATGTKVQREKETTYTHVYVKVRHHFFCQEDGSCVDAVTEGEAMDTSDKAFNKAQTASYKYALFHILNIPTEEESKNDADNSSPGASAEPSGDQQSYQRQQANSKPRSQSRPAGRPTGVPQQAPPSQTQATQNAAQGGRPAGATQAQLSTIAKLCAATSDKKPQPFREQDLYAMFHCQKETCTQEIAYKIIGWFKKHYPELEA